MNSPSEIQDAAITIQSFRPNFQPEVALILGSGLGLIAEEIQSPTIIPYHQIPGFPTPNVAGHKGQLVLGELAGKKVMVMQGRFHYYEGHSMQRIAFPIQLMKELGVRQLIITASTAGVNPNYEPGDLILINDHINLGFNNPLKGERKDGYTPNYPSLFPYYSSRLQQLALNKASRLKLTLKQGVYLFTPGPSYETPAEIKMMRLLGADVVGMSTVPEVLAAAYCGLEIMAITYIANMGSGMVAGAIDHVKTLGVFEMIKEDLIALVRGIVGGC